MERALEIPKQHDHSSPAASHAPSMATVAAPLSPFQELQQQAGNQAIQQLLRLRFLQAKLAISNPDDPAEREADQIAHIVMRSHAGAPASSPCSCSGNGEMCEECQQTQSQPTISRRAAAPSTPAYAPKIVSDVLRSPGHPLDSAARAFFEPRFGRDFSHVRIHTDAQAAASAKSIQAHAYTAGPSIAFAPGQYAPESPAGRTVLAHELTHVLQQSSHGSQSASGGNAVLHRTNDPAACLAQKDEILPSIGALATIDREEILNETLDTEYGPLKKNILANKDARTFVCEAGVPAVLTLWDTRTVAGELDVPAANGALEANTKIYSQNLDASWLRRRRIARAEKELDVVASSVGSEEKQTRLPQLLLPVRSALQRENVLAAAHEMEMLIPVFELAANEFDAAAKTAFQLRERLNDALGESIKAKNQDYAASPEALEKAVKTATMLRLELEVVHRGIDVGGLVKTSQEVAVAAERLRQMSVRADSDTIRGLRDSVETFRKQIVDGSKQVTDLAGAARRVSFVLRYFAALNTPGFANAPAKAEVSAMRGHLDDLGDDLDLLFGSGAKLSFAFFSELAARINGQLDERSAMENALGHETALVPSQTDVLGYFHALEKKSNDQVSHAYTAYAKAFFEHRIVTKPEDLDVRDLKELFARPLSLAGLRPLVCTGYALLGANLLAAAGARTEEFIVAVRATADQVKNNQLDEGHAVAVLKRKGATLYISNELLVDNPNDAVGPNAVDWDHPNFPLISGSGPTVQAATAALKAKLASH